jgi:pimeloyl-ACP methyl ester carboxylesterase
LKGSTTSTDGVPIHYEDHGKGSLTLVFVHGWCCDLSYWSKQLGYFGKKYRVVALDLAGHGESGLGRKDWTIEAFGEDVASVIKKLALKEVVIIGHSMGGEVIVEAALQMPELVRGLVWVDAWRNLDDLWTKARADEFAASFRADFPSTARKFVKSMFRPDSDRRVVDFVVEDMSSAPADVALSVLVRSITSGTRLVSILPKLKPPLVEINADYKPTNIRSLEKNGIKKIVIMPGTSHFMFMETPDAFNRVLETIIHEF